MIYPNPCESKTQEDLCDIIVLLTEKHKSVDCATLYSLWYMIIARGIGLELVDVEVPGSEHTETAALDERITTLDNETALESNCFYFKKDSQLANDALCMRDYVNRTRIQHADFGLTCVFMAFSSYASQYRYPIMVYNMQFIREFEIVEKLLLNFLKTLKIKSNLATEFDYNLQQNRCKFTGNKYIKIRELVRFQEVLKNNNDTSVFIELITRYHVSIIETFFTFSSCHGRSKFPVNECRELTKNAFNFVFPKHNIVNVYTGDYWFPVPKNPVWFAYKEGKCVFKTFTSRDTDSLVQREFDRLKTQDLIYGFITQSNYIYPIVFHDPRINTWADAIKFILSNGLNCAFRPNDDDTRHRLPIVCIHFVSEHYNREIYKLIRQK